MPTVGFIGLGNMGGPVAGHIQRAGFPMIVCDLRAEATRPFRERGATVADSIIALVDRSDIIITALPMPDDVEKVAREILQGIKPGAIYIDISTSPPSLLRDLEPLFRAKGAHLLDAPVASGQPGAARGIHEVMVGGAREIFERAKPVLDAFGDQVHPCRAAGLGKYLQTRPSNDQQHHRSSHRRRAYPRRQSRRRHCGALGVRAPRHGRAHARAAQPSAAERVSQRLRDRHFSAQAAAQRRRPGDGIGPRTQRVVAIGEHRRAKTDRRDQSRLGRQVGVHRDVQASGGSGAGRAPRRRCGPANKPRNIFQPIPRRIERVQKVQAVQFVQNVFRRFVLQSSLAFLFPRLERFERFERLEHSKRLFMAKHGFKVLDSDMHILEPADLWQRYMDAKFKQRAPVGLTDHVRDLRLVGPDGKAWGRPVDPAPGTLPPPGHIFHKNQKLFKPTQRARLVVASSARRHGRGRHRCGDSLSQPRLESSQRARTGTRIRRGACPRL